MTTIPPQWCVQGVLEDSSMEIASNGITATVCDRKHENIPLGFIQFSDDNKVVIEVIAVCESKVNEYIPTDGPYEIWRLTDGRIAVMLYSRREDMKLVTHWIFPAPTTQNENYSKFCTGLQMREEENEPQQ